MLFFAPTPVEASPIHYSPFWAEHAWTKWNYSYDHSYNYYKLHQGKTEPHERVLKWKNGGRKQRFDRWPHRTNSKPRWQNGQKEELRGRLVRHRWMARVSGCLTNVPQACSSIPFQNQRSIYQPSVCSLAAIPWPIPEQPFRFQKTWWSFYLPVFLSVCPTVWATQTRSASKASEAEPTHHGCSSVWFKGACMVYVSFPLFTQIAYTVVYWTYCFFKPGCDPASSQHTLFHFSGELLEAFHYFL